jgi:hypothetical protein
MRTPGIRYGLMFLPVNIPHYIDIPAQFKQSLCIVHRDLTKEKTFGFEYGERVEV